MTYYFPLGRPATIPINIAYSNLATTASSAVNSDISAATASHAGSVQNTPPNGTAGTDQNLAACGTGTVGPVGPAGPIGPKGTSISLCPAGTKDCSSSITDKLPGFPVVCLEIPEGCTSAGTPCPTTLSEVLTPSSTTTTTSTSTSTTSTTTEACNSYSYGITEDINGCAQNYDLTLRVRGALANGKQVYTDEICSSPLLEAPFIQTLDAGTYTNYALNLSGVVTNVQINETCAGA